MKKITMRTKCSQIHSLSIQNGSRFYAQNITCNYLMLTRAFFKFITQ